MVFSIKAEAVGKSRFDSKRLACPQGACFIPRAMHEDLILHLRRREAVIADHAWRDRDASGHLDALREVSEKIAAWAQAHQQEIDPRLRHYLTNSSFAKALAHCQELDPASAISDAKT